MTKQPAASQQIAAISPSSAERLVACALRVAFEQASTGRGRSSASPWSLVGQAVHRAIELNLADEPMDLESAWSRACEELAGRGVDPRSAPSARRTLLRLKRGLPDLLAYIAAREPTGKLRERRLASPDGRVTGQIDLLLVGGRPAIVDYKSGLVLDDGEPSEHFRRQLMIYAWLAEAALGLDVAEGALFSLRDGIVEFDVSKGARTSVMSQLFAVVDAYNERVPGPQPATPSDEACEHCQYVGSCSAAWEALDAGTIERFGWGDAARCTVREPIVLSAGGTAAIPLDVVAGTCDGPGMLIDVPSALVVGFDVGSRFSAWRLGRRSDDPLTLAWREGTSAIAAWQ